MKNLGLVITAFVLTLLTFPSLAQNKYYGGQGGFNAGYMILDLDGLNKTLSKYGYDELDGGQFTFGGHGHAILNNVIVGGEGATFSGTSKSTGDYTTQLGGGYGFFNLGYIFLNTGNLLIHGVGGVGTGRFNLEVINNAKNDFVSLIQNADSKAEFHASGLLLKACLGGDYYLTSSKDDDGGGGIFIGLRLGYIFSPNNWEWKVEDNSLTNTAEIDMSGPFFQITIGGGGYGN